MVDGSNIRTAREAKGISQAELARQAGTSQQTVDRIERGETEHSRAIPAIQQALETAGQGSEMTGITPAMVLRTILCANPTAEQIMAALAANGFKIVATDGVVTPTDDPRAFVQEIIDRRKIAATTLSKQVGLAASTLNRFLRGDREDGLLSTRTLQKIKEWDRAQGIAPDATENPTGFVLEIMARRNMSPAAVAIAAGISPSTLTRSLNDPNHKFQISTTTLQKIREWDRSHEHSQD